MQWPIAQRPPVGDLPASISPTRIALPLLLLAAQTLPKNSALSLLRINMLVKRLMADGQYCCNLLRTPLHAHQRTGFFPYPRLYGWGIATVLRTLCRRLKPITTPVTSPQSKVMSKSFLKTLKRDYAKLANRPDSKTVMTQLQGWFDDCNNKSFSTIL